MKQIDGPYAENRLRALLDSTRVGEFFEAGWGVYVLNYPGSDGLAYIRRCDVPGQQLTVMPRWQYEEAQ